MLKDDFLRDKLKELYDIVSELEKEFPGRKFSLDGHLLGSIGEAFAEYYYGIKLALNGTKCHDGTAEVGGKTVNVQIKITQGTSVDINEVPEYLLVLFLKKKSGKVFEVYNGPGETVLKDSKRTKNGWYSRCLSKLSEMDKAVNKKVRIEAKSTIEKWDKSIRNF